MDVQIKSWLYDILKAIDEVDIFSNNLTIEFLDYANDLKTKRAVERNVEIIGEAMRRILGKDVSIELSNAREIVDTRNRIIHGYDSVSDEIVWTIIREHLPKLRREIENLLSR
jgi:uncharacterized protein with HEPN domain